MGRSGPGWTTSTGQARTSTPAWRRLRAAVLARDQHRCQQTGCGAPARQVDHIVPVADGGTDDPTNLAAICDPHHGAKTAAEGVAARRARRTRPAPTHPGLAQPTAAHDDRT